MTTIETAKLTGIPAELLVKMRSRNTTVTTQSGPPYAKAIDKDGIPHFVYNKRAVMSWMAKRNITLTALEAAELIGITRLEILAYTGVKRFDFAKYSVLVQPGRNLFLLVLKKRRARRA